jgi:hypothetical protein
MPQVVTELTGGVASYVARLPTPAVNVTEWTESLDISPALAEPSQVIAKPLITNDDKDEVTS